MAVIGLIGPHAVGKTTAVYRWLEQFSGKLTGVIADDQWEARSREDRTRVREWKGTKEEKATAVQRCLDSSTIYVVDSARGFSTWVDVLPPGTPLIVLTCPEPCGRKFIEARRATKAKPNPLSEYWTPRRLDYECNGYLLNYVKKRTDLDVKHFIIEDRERDWPVVDAYFQKVFVRLWNRRPR